MNKLNTFVALLRGINVGGKNLLGMKELVTVFENLGYCQVQTYIQSGNVVFQAAATGTRELSRRIATAVCQDREFAPQVIVLTIHELRKAIAANPFPEGAGDPKSLHLGFLESPPANPDEKRLLSLQSGSERFKLAGKVFYLHAPEGIGRSRLAANLEKALGVVVTGRNWRSVNAIISLALKVASHRCSGASR